MDDSFLKHDGFAALKQRSQTFAGLSNSGKQRPRPLLDSLSEEELHHLKDGDRSPNKSLTNFLDELNAGKFKEEIEATAKDSQEKGQESGDFEWQEYLQQMQILEKQRRIERTAMGEYVPPYGGKPLTQLAIPMPGPADYCPTMHLNKPTAPHYSLGGKNKYSPIEETPGANRYKTELDLNWKGKKISMKGRGKPVGIVPEGEDWKTSVGPAKYEVKNGNFGTIPPRHKIGLPRREFVDTGPPRIPVKPVDTLGFYTPGPAKYRPKSSYWRKGVEKSIGLPLKKRESDVPGPGEYDIPEPDHEPIYSFGISLNPAYYAPGSHTPGPGAYKIGTTLGKSPATLIVSRHIVKKKDNTPAPNTYILPAYASGKPKYSLTYRPFERAVTPSPAPGQYEVSRDNIRKEGPAFTCRQKLRYPSILHLFKRTTDIPTQKFEVSPNSHNPHRDFSKNDKPKYTIAKKIEEKIDDRPGPATYHIKDNRFEARAFSIRKAVERNPAKIGPGPAAYNPKPPSGPSYSISGWNRKEQGKEQSSAPAANTYILRSNQTRTGLRPGPAASLKGRPSPYIYSGFKRPVQA